MMKYRIYILFFVVILLLAASSKSLSVSAEQSSSDNSISMTDIHKAFPTAKDFDKVDKGVYEIYGKGRKVLGAVVLSAPYAKGVKGFSGPTPLLIALDKELHVKGVYLLNNTETPNFVQHVKESGLMKLWDGLSTNEAANKDVDAVSGATFTSTAVIRNMKAAMEKAKIDLTEEKTAPAISKKNMAKNTRQVKKITTATIIDRDSAAATPDTASVAEQVVPATLKTDTAVPASVWIKNIATVVVALLGMILYFNPKMMKRWHFPMIILSIIVLGFWQKSMLSFSQFIAWLRQGVPLSMQWGLLALAIISFGLPLFFGKKYYCVYVCPFGGLQEVLGKMCKRKLKMTQGLVHAATIMRRTILLALLFAIITFSAFDFSRYEPLSMFNFITAPGMAPIIALVIAITSLVLSIFISKPWCRFACPLGQTLDLFKQSKEHSAMRKKTEETK